MSFQRPQEEKPPKPGLLRKLFRRSKPPKDAQDTSIEAFLHKPPQWQPVAPSPGFATYQTPAFQNVPYNVRNPAAPPVPPYQQPSFHQSGVRPQDQNRYPYPQYPVYSANQPVTGQPRTFVPLSGTSSATPHNPHRAGFMPQYGNGPQRAAYPLGAAQTAFPATASSGGVVTRPQQSQLDNYNGSTAMVNVNAPIMSTGHVAPPYIPPPKEGAGSSDMVIPGSNGASVYRTFSVSRRQSRRISQYGAARSQAAQPPIGSSVPPSQRPQAAITELDSILPRNTMQQRMSIELPPGTYIIFQKNDTDHPTSSGMRFNQNPSPYSPDEETYTSQRRFSSDRSTPPPHGFVFSPPESVNSDTGEENVDEETYSENRRRRTSVDPQRSISLDYTRDVLPYIDHNERYADVSDPPFWYIKDPEDFPLGDPKHLCGTCRHINISALYSQQSCEGPLPPADEYIQVGTLIEMIAKMENCGLCHFMMRIVAREVATTNLGRNFTLSEMGEEFFGKYLEVDANGWEPYSLFPIQFETRYHEYAIYMCRGEPPNPSTVTDARVAMPDDLMAFREVHTCCRRPNTGRIIQNKTSMDADWIRDMLETCDERSVGRPGLDCRLVDIRAIDVHRMCIVSLESEVRYVTLSYVWGKGPHFKLERQNRHWLQRDQGLEAFWDQIPKTIRDAVTLTRAIGEDYLWVDALCIVQDDPDDKARQIKHMGNIYRYSVLTIIARSGDDSNSGIPGVDPDSRDVPQMLGIAGKSVLCNVLATDDEEDYSTAMPWDTRAWTMQENVLSQRKLIITEQYYKFWCSHTSSVEDTYCRHSYWKVGHRFQNFFFFNSDHSDFISPTKKSSNFDTYGCMVSDYTRRDMTRQEDAESAIVGVLQSISGMFCGEFIYGLPDSEIEFAMLWVPMGSSRRRVDENTGAPLFPSWSWLGWIGPVAYPWEQERAFPLTTRGCDVAWRDSRRADWTEFYTGAFRPSPVGWNRVEDDPFNWETDLYPGSRFCSPVEDGHYRPFLSRPPHPQYPHRLGIRTTVASFRLSGEVLQRPETYNSYLRISYMHVLDSRGFRVGLIYVPSEESFTPEQARLFHDRNRLHHFIVLSRASIHNDPRVGYDTLNSMGNQSRLLASGRSANPGDLGFVHIKGMFDTRVYDENVPYCLFNVMLIERDLRSDAVLRVNVGRIHVDAFRMANPSTRRFYLE